MKIALFKSTQYANSDPMPCGEYMEGSRDYARTSEYVDVEFPKLCDEAVVKQQLDALDRTERELREQFESHLNGIKARRAELQALTYVPA
jgi:hypothetical protein